MIKKYVSMMAIAFSLVLVSACGGTASEEESKAAGSAAGSAVGQLLSSSNTANYAQAHAVITGVVDSYSRGGRPQSADGDQICALIKERFEAQEGFTCTLGKCGMEVSGSSATININVSCKSTDSTTSTTTCGEDTYTMKAPYFTFAMQISGNQSGASGSINNEMGGDVKGGKLAAFTKLACKMDVSVADMKQMSDKLGASATEDEYAEAVAKLVECELGGKSIDMKVAMKEYKAKGCSASDGNSGDEDESVIF